MIVFQTPGEPNNGSKISCAFKGDDLYTVISNNTNIRIFKINTSESVRIEHKLPDNSRRAGILSSNKGPVVSCRQRFNYKHYYLDTWKATKNTSCFSTNFKSNTLILIGKTLPKKIHHLFPKNLIEQYKKLTKRQGLIYKYSDDNTLVFETKDIIKACAIGDNLAAFVSKSETIFVDL